jgi:hypothetical protein
MDSIVTTELRHQQTSKRHCGLKCFVCGYPDADEEVAKSDEEGAGENDDGDDDDDNDDDDDDEQLESGAEADSNPTGLPPGVRIAPKVGSSYSVIGLFT